MKRRTLVPDAKPRYLVGANYWGSSAAHRMWERWDPASVERDIELAQAIGLNVLRTFFWSPQLNPLPGIVDETVLERFAEFLVICARHDIRVFPTIFVGHMSGTNWDIPWRQGRDFCADPYMVYWEADLVRRLVARFRGNTTIAGWILSNELPNYTGPLTPETATMWTRAMHQAVKEADPGALVATGDGARCEARPDYDGFRVEWMHTHVDWIGVHLYNYFLYEQGDWDDLRKSYHIPCRLRYVDVGEKPVLLEEFGLSTVISGGEEASGYYRSVLYSSLLNGSCGALAWCLTDFDLADEVPYRFQPHELQYGVADASGRLKPQGEVLASFARFARSFDLTSFQMAEPAEAIFVPYALYRDLPSHRGFDRLRAYRALEEAFTLAKMAGLNPDFVRSIDDLRSRRLVLLPGGARLESPEWQAMEKWVRGGGTLYYCYTGFHGSVYAQNFPSLFGCRQRVRFGQHEQPEEPVVRLTAKRDFGAIRAGTAFELPRGPLTRESAYLPVELIDAAAVMEDARGRPALVEHLLGKGRVYLSTYPLEYMLLGAPDANLQTSAYRIYEAVAAEADVLPRLTGKHPWIEAGVLTNGNGDELLIAVNHAHRPVACRIDDRRTGESVNLALGMKGVAIYRLEGGTWKPLPG